MVHDRMNESWRSLQQIVHPEIKHPEIDLLVFLEAVTLFSVLPSLPSQQSHHCLETCPFSVCCRSGFHSTWSQTTFFCRRRRWSARPGRPPVSALLGAHTSTRTLSYHNIQIWLQRAPLLLWDDLCVSILALILWQITGVS